MKEEKLKTYLELVKFNQDQAEAYQPLFEALNDVFGVTALISDMDEILSAANETQRELAILSKKIK